MYARIENGTVVGTVPALPAVWGNVSGFDKADAATVKAAGFLPLVDDRPATVEAWQTVTGPSYTVGDESVTATYTVQDADLAAMKAEARRKIDIRAEQSRLRYITDGAGQAMAYRQKFEEAEACAADPAPTADRYPHLAAEVGITAPTIEDVAQAVLLNAEQWRVVSADIERARLAGKKAVVEASDGAAVYAALAAVAFPGEPAPEVVE